MREIKFRAWDGSNFVEKMRVGEMELFDDMLAFRFQHFDCDPSEVIFEQFTSLCDKNGREIFEGDAIKHPDGHVSIIKWIPELYAFDFGKSTCVTDQEEGCVEDGEVEVIGNIHESPDLQKSH